jgi:hypothetical protein
MKRTDAEIRDILFRVQRGLSAYISYLAACEMNQAFSEYLLYEPLLRILTSRNYTVHCEYECPGIEQPKRGDKKRLDFFATKDELEFCIEVKWVKTQKVSFANDTEKLRAFAKHSPGSPAFLLIFERQSVLEEVSIDSENYRERGNAIYADLRKTRFGCRVFRLRSSGNKAPVDDVYEDDAL